MPFGNFTQKENIISLLINIALCHVNFFLLSLFFVFLFLPFVPSSFSIITFTEVPHIIMDLL